MKRRTRKNLSKIRGGASFNFKSLGDALEKGVGFNAKTRASPKKSMNPKKYPKNAHTRCLSASELKRMIPTNEEDKK